MSSGVHLPVFTVLIVSHTLDNNNERERVFLMVVGSFRALCMYICA